MSHRENITAEATLLVHARAFDIEGDRDVQLWHLLVTLRRYSEHHGIDFDALVRETKEYCKTGV